MYLDKLDGRIDAEFFDRNAQLWRAKQQRIMAEINGHRAAKQSYIEEGIKLLELAQRAGQLFEKQSAPEKRRLLDFVVSNSTWKDGELAAEYRQPFALLAYAVSLEHTTQLAGAASTVENENWLPGVDSNHDNLTNAESMSCRVFNGLNCRIGREEPPLEHNSYMEPWTCRNPTGLNRLLEKLYQTAAS